MRNASLSATWIPWARSSCSGRCGGGPTHDWSTTAICELLRCPPGWATDELARLRAAGLLACDGAGHRFAPATPRLRAAVDRLVAAWRRDRAVVARLIVAPRRRIPGG
jgi:hypothetical protein